MANDSFHSSDVPLLYYFSVVAEENNLHRAAERLFMSQPPLSRRIKHLEERLGLTLFIRHTKGLTLTEDGARVLEAVRPLLKSQVQTFRRLQALTRPSAKVFTLGFTTAFEQGVFIEVEKRLRGHYGKRLRVVRETSPKLVRSMRKGRLDAALVALPLDAPELTEMPLLYDEPLMAVLQEGLSESKSESPPLRVFNGKPLFWFRRESNPAFFDHTRGIFVHAGFHPVFLEEPAEHDVLLARIAAGEGMGLLPASFSVVRREGVVFVSIRADSLGSGVRSREHRRHGRTRGNAWGSASPVLVRYCGGTLFSGDASPRR